MLKSFILFSLLFSTQLGLAQSVWNKSPHRDPGESFLKFMPAPRPFQLPSDPPLDTPADLSRPYDLVKDRLRPVTEWASLEVLNERFNLLRDLRFMDDDMNPAFKRRITWMYPDDGCYARAQLLNVKSLEFEFEIPDKVFVFGDLVADTPNAPGGRVSWWYHVAPIVQVAGEKYVLDPSIEPRRPLKLDEWVKKLRDRNEQTYVSLCKSGAYLPYDSCSRQVRPVEEMAMTDQLIFLSPEWDRLVTLGRVPEDELGDKPPWKTKP